MKPDPLNELANVIENMTGKHADLVMIRRLFLRVTGQLDPHSTVIEAVTSFIKEAEMVSLMLALADGEDVHDGKKRLSQMLDQLRKDVQMARSAKLH